MTPGVKESLPHRSTRWAAIGSVIHVFTVGGREHVCDPTCWCQPKPDPTHPVLLVHNDEP